MSSLIRRTRTPAAFATHSYAHAWRRQGLAASWNGKHGRRALHLGPVGSAADGLITWSAHGFSSLHGLGLPWYVCIPLVAACVNFTFRLPLQYYSRRLLYKQAKLNPLLTAWTSRHAAVMPAAEGSQTKFMRDVKLAGLVERSRSRIYKTWGVQRWKAFAPLLGFFPFVVVSESLRRLCGAPTGALSHALGAGTSSSTGNVVSSSLFDASLSQGGSLWFADLTAMDPYFVLPVLCTAILARNSWFKMSTERLRDLLSLDNSGIRQAPIVMLQKALGRALLAVPLFPLLFADLPSAIFLYWAASFSLTQVNDVLLEKLIPKPKKPERIRPPLRPVLPFLRNTGQIVSKK